MRKSILVFASGLALWACQRGDVSVEMPIYDWTSTDILDISKVEINDTATVVDFDVKFMPKYWFMIDSATTLRADGKDYKLRYIDGYEANKHITMPESGQMPLKLVFEPMPKSTKTFDFIEGDAQGAFRITGIDLTGKDKWGYPEGLPAEMRKEPANDPLPEIEMAAGTAKLNLHLLGYDPEVMPKNISMLDLSGVGGMEIRELQIDSLGNSEVAVNVMGLPSTLGFYFGSNPAAKILVDGSDTNTDLYIDMRHEAYNVMATHRGDSAVSKLHTQFAYSNGRYANLNSQIASTDVPQLYVDHATFDYNLDPDQYVGTITDMYNKAMTDNDTLQWQALKKYNKYVVDNAYFDLVTRAPRIIATAIMFQKHEEPDFNALSKKYAMPKDKAAQLLKGFDMTDRWMIATDRGMNYITFVEEGYLEPTDLSKAAAAIAKNAEKATKAKITAEEAKAIADSCGTYSGFVADAFNQLANSGTVLQERYNKVVTPTPDAANDKLFEAIVAPYKGKVVVVDFWNTWCGPCRNALGLNEPLKSGELADPDIVFVYIANETSPMAGYVDMAEQIRGVHFRLNAEQWRAVCDKFGIESIPSYVLVDRDGNASLQNDKLRNHDTYASTIKEALK